ncbi:MAG: steroid-22-oyl-CoA synthetase [Acidimicrobiaceae bacterium]|nr:steroid-22-oyl-CoA synthetase [Acidimicrobiaceae bacterium]
MTPDPPTVAGLLRARAGDGATGLLFEDQRWSWAEVVQASADRAAWAAGLLAPDRPAHIGVLLENVPEFAFWLGGAALAGATVVGINPTRSGPDLARDIAHTDCQVLVTESAHLPLVDRLSLDLPVLVVDAPDYRPPSASPLPPSDREPGDLFLLLFTSGTSGAPKACLCSQGRLARIGGTVAQMFALVPGDVCYQAMPLFHSNALMAGWAPALAAGAGIALRRRFSASAFLDDVRRFGATYANYVGKPLSYVLATPEQPDDADNPLTRVFGNEATDLDAARFGSRFGCRVVDGYGSTEGAVSVSRTADTPPGALGRGLDGTAVLDPVTGRECPPARFDTGGRLLNPDECVGELASRLGGRGFEGYWNNDQASAARVRGGIYWTGDLAYRDEAGFFYFAGRDSDRLRVDGENLDAAPIERVLARYPSVVLAAVYAVPNEVVGDDVMAALEVEPGAGFDAEEFGAFLSRQPDLGTKSSPRYVRIASALPVTLTNKVLKRELRREAWHCDDPIWWRPRRDDRYRLLTPEDVTALPRSVLMRPPPVL